MNLPPLPPFPLVLDALFYAVLPAFAGAAMVLAVLRKVGGERAAVLGTALALATGLAAGNLVRGTLPFVPRGRGWEWLFWATLAALAVGTVARGPRVPAVAGWLLRAAASSLAAWLLVPADSSLEKPWLYPVFAGLVLANWAVLEFASRRPAGGALPLGIAVVALGGAAVLIHAHSARFTDAATLLAAALGGVAVVAWWFRSDASGAMPAAAVFLPGIMLAGFTETYSDVPWSSFALVAMAPLAPVLTLVWPVCQLRDRYLQLLRFVLLLPALACAVVLAMRAESLEF